MRVRFPPSVQILNMKRQSGKIKVIVIDDVRLDGVGWWRNSEPFAALDKTHGQYLEIHQATESVDVRLLRSADVVVRFRPNSKASLEFLQLCKELGLKVILDIDDNLWKIPLGHPLFLDSLSFGRGVIDEIYSLADAVWCSTDALRYAVGDLGRCEVMPNAVLPEDLPEKPAEWSAAAMWRGNDKQVSDLLHRDAVEWFERNNDKYNWTFAGYVPDYPFKGNVTFQAKMSPLAYFLSLKKKQTNFMWKPLTVNAFNDCKSNIAWIEATMAGGVCVTNYAGKDGWQCALPDFTDDPELVRNTWELSKEVILEHYNLLKVNEARFESILKVLE